MSAILLYNVQALTIVLDSPVDMKRTLGKGELIYLDSPVNMNRNLGKRRLNVFAKSIGPCQPAQSAQADMGRYFSLSLHRQRTVLHHDSIGCLTKWTFMDP